VQKEQIVKELREKMERARCAVLTDYKGLNVAQVTELRDALAAERVEYRVVKNTLMRLACRETNAAVLEPHLEGTCALAIAYEDPTAPARVLTKFVKKSEHLRIKAGVVGPRLLNVEEVGVLAELPSREELLTKLVCLLNALPTRLVTVLSGVPRALLNVLSAIREGKEKA
jgi:large subunit ribosomal protein L10